VAVRSFVCIPLSEDIVGALHQWQSDLKPDKDHLFKWVEPSKMHITLKFLGDVEENTLPKLTDTISNAVREMRPFDLKIASVGAFPHPNNARVLWAGVTDGREALCRLQDTVSNELEQVHGFDPERRDYHPHVTVARAKGRGKGPSMEKSIARVADDVWGVQPVKYVTLMRSDLRRSGPVYTPIAEVELEN